MPGPSPGMTENEERAVSGWVYIVTNRPNGILYVGVTSQLPARIWQHRTGAVPGFTKRYGLKRLVCAEPHDRIEDAIAREKQLKKWTRARKVRLIEVSNPRWEDLYDQLV
jgi:putative endonuclease